MDTVLDFEKPIAALEEKLKDLKEFSTQDGVDFGNEIKSLEEKLNRLATDIYGSLTPWQKIQLSRHPQRPYTADYITEIFENFDEFHGDRHFSDDRAIIGGVADLDGEPVMVIGHQKGRKTKEKVERNFGMAKPEGYRKAQRLMRMAEKFKLPIICLIDTPGAYPGIGAEERGQSEAIAKSLLEMFDLKTPIISVVIGEGGSGGALAMGIADRVLMQEYSVYSVISPESCASILWSDAAKGPRAAEALKMDATQAQKLGVVDGVVKEPLGGAQRDFHLAATNLKNELKKWIDELSQEDPEDLPEMRQQKFRNVGLQFIEGQS